MEEQYKGHVIRVTTEKDKGAYPWKPICRIMYQRSRELIKQLDWDIGYDTPDQAEKVGLLWSAGLRARILDRSEASGRELIRRFPNDRGARPKPPCRRERAGVRGCGC